MSFLRPKFSQTALSRVCQVALRLSLKPTLPSSTLLLSSVMAVTLAGCSSVAVEKQSAAKTLVAQRGNIVTDNKLSTAAASALLSAGLNEEACMLRFERCLMQLSDSLFNEHYRQALAIFAELHYTKALRLGGSEACQNGLARSPLDPYYANAPIPEAELNKQRRLTKYCLNTYHAELLEAVKYSYTYLFYDELEHDFADSARDPQKMSRRLPSELDIQTQDIYNSASNDIITQIYESSESDKPLYSSTVNIEHFAVNPEKKDNESADTTVVSAETAAQQVKVMKIDVADYQLDVYLPNEKNYLVNASTQNKALTDLVSTYELRLSGLNSISKRDGFGISFVASLNDRYTTSIRQLLSKTLPASLANKDKDDKEQVDESQPINRIYPTGHLLLTGLIKPQGNSVLEVLTHNKLDIHLYNPYRTEKVTLLGEDYPLAANFSASYGLWLSENQLNSVGYLNLLAPQNEASLPRLFKLEPYDPNKRVIIMLHGLASSPATWVNLTNDIFNDATLRDNYQVWQVFYPTNLPILENRYQIQQLIETAYKQVDPDGTDAASSNSVIISHSMGAVIARMLVSDTDLSTRLDSLNERSQPAAIKATETVTDGPLVNEETADLPDFSNDKQVSAMLKKSFGNNKELAERFALSPLQQVDTVVFLSAPFRGTDYADRWFTRAMRRIIHLPLGLVQTVTSNLTTIATEGELAQNPLGALYLENGASQLSDKSSFVKLTKDLPIVPQVTYHSIIANADSDIARGLSELQSSMVSFDLSQEIEAGAGAETATGSGSKGVTVHNIAKPKTNEVVLPDDSTQSELLVSDTASKNGKGFGDQGLGDKSNAKEDSGEDDISNNDIDEESYAMSAAEQASPTDAAYIAAITVEEALDDDLTEKLSDGIVPYKSAHLDGAASETIIIGGHSIQENPQTILTLRRILHQQLKKD